MDSTARLRAASRWLAATMPWLLLALLLAPVGRASTDVAAVTDRLPIQQGVEWCFTPRDIEMAQVAAGYCRLRPLRPEDYRHGFERRAVWLRLSLSNSSTETLERWVEVGHPRLSRVQLHYRNPSGGWTVTQVGLAVPRDSRDAVGRRYDINRVELAPGAQTDVWIRVESDAQLALETVIWEPAAFRDRRESVDRWLAFALGAMTLSLAFLLTASLIYGERFYLMFLLIVAGESTIETVRTGFMARHLWPGQYPMPLWVMTLGSLVAATGFVGYAFRTLPSISRRLALRRTVIALSILVVLFQGYAITVDYGVGTTIWSSLFMPLTIILGWYSFLDARTGHREASWIFYSVVLLAFIGMLRLPLLMRFLPHYLNDVISPLSTMFVILAIVFILVDRERMTRQGLALSRAKAASQVSFLARMSHELRAPLDIILGTTQLLMRSARDMPVRQGDVAGAGLPDILQHGRHLLTLVDEILDYARGICGELEIRREPALLRSLLESLTGGWRLLAARQRNRFELADLSPAGSVHELVLLLDTGRLRQVLDNLLANAARHTHDGVIRLTYRVETVDATQYRVHFEVSDDGEGIATVDHARVFEPFERAGRTARYSGMGAGMGLAVSRQLVELMGGTIALRSAPGLGATLSFSILAQRAADEAPIGTAGEREHGEIVGYVGATRRIVVVDDDAASRSNLAGLFRALGFEVEELGSGRAALARLAEPPAPDLVITDQFMPDGDGWLVLEGVERSLPDVPCLLVSAAPPEYPATVSMERRFAAVFLKPLDHDALVRHVGELLDVEWRWSSDPGVEHRVVQSAEAPEQRDLDELAAMVRLGEVTAINEWARCLRSRRPDKAAFADRVAEAAESLDFPQLEKLAGGNVQ